ncbi:MAG: FAD:protein FMN transferase [Coriobacteriia bacterium]|nr:FAD:protein FMN transferase [Coriobacteriia bacterium]
MRFVRPTVLSALVIVTSGFALLASTGCAERYEPVIVSREALGTIVTVTAYGSDGDAVEAAVGDAFAAMDEVETALSAYVTDDADTGRSSAATGTPVTIAQFNRDPYSWQPLAADAITILDRLVTLGVTESFSPTLLNVIALYDFGGTGRVPSEDEIDSALRTTRMLSMRETTAGVEARFSRPEKSATFLSPPPGLDLSGAAKGLGLDHAADVLKASGDVDAALLTSGSTTVAFGDKPDKTPWRIGIEDPRDTEAVIAVVEVRGEVTVSTSGDYQQYFEREGVRYHHILDPETGLPAPGIRSLSVVGAADGLDSDILSTALFVLGQARAEDYARQHELGLVLVDDSGEIRVLEGPGDAQWRIVLDER